MIDPSSADIPIFVDCLVIGGGPAGLTAAIYLARFHLSVMVIDAGNSRASLIPLTRNHAGFPDGISGHDLLARMGQQAMLYGAQLRVGCVYRLKLSAAGFVAHTSDSTIHARVVLLATGVVNRRPAMIDDATHAKAVKGGQLRYCPICDGYEVTDRKVAVLGTGERGFNEALFLRSYTANVTLIAPDGAHDLTSSQRAELTDAGIHILDECSTIRFGEGSQLFVESEGGSEAFESLYPALGSDIRSELAGQLGAHLSEDGCLTVDANQRTNVPGLYAAGDVVLGLDQISHAMGEGGVAATTIRNDLALRIPLRR